MKGKLECLYDNLIEAQYQAAVFGKDMSNEDLDILESMNNLSALIYSKVVKDTGKKLITMQSLLKGTPNEIRSNVR